MAPLLSAHPWPLGQLDQSHISGTSGPSPNCCVGSSKEMLGIDPIPFALGVILQNPGPSDVLVIA